jgi:putative hydrolase of the HAD superfamily
MRSAGPLTLAAQGGSSNKNVVTIFELLRRSVSCLSSMVHPTRDFEPTLGVIFDGDDTLWSSERLYDDARSRARLIVSGSGLDGALWEERERLLDVQNVAKFKYSIERFPTSCFQAYEELCVSERLPIDSAIADQIRKTAQSVFECDPPIMTGARETLALLRSRGARLALLTKGDYELQRRRVERSGLREFFHVIKIVPEKSPEVIGEVVAALGVSTASAWMVGNSMRSDVFPAMNAGLRAVRIPAHVWEHERSHDHITIGSVITTSHLTDVPALISK